MNDINLMQKELREALNRKLRFFGMTISGGSYDRVEKTWWITLNDGVSATYDRHRVAEMLLNELEAQRIVLDGIGFSQQELDECKHTLQELRKPKKRWQQSNPRKALA